MTTMGNRMRVDSDTDEKDDLLRRAGAMDADDPHDALRADVLGSIAGANPNSARYLGKIDSLITAHGALSSPPPESASSWMAGANNGPGTTMRPPAGRMTPPLEAPDLGSRSFSPDPGMGVERMAPAKPAGALGRIPEPRMQPTEAPSLEKTPNALMGKPTLGPDRDTSLDPIESGAPGIGLIPTRMGAPQKPGILGRIGGVARRMGEVAGDIFAPGIMAMIPGTELNKRLEAQAQEARRERQQHLSTEETRAGAEKTTAETRAKLEPSEEAKNLAEAGAAGQGKTPDEATFKDLLTGNSGQPRINPKTQQPYTPLEAFQEVTAAKTGGKETQEQNKLAFQGIVGKVDAAHLPTGPKDLDKSLDTAAKRGLITPQEHASARAYLAANPTPGTNLTVHVAGQESAQSIKNANTYYHYQDDNGVTKVAKGDKVPAGVEATPIGNEQAFATYMAEGHAANIVQQSLNRIAQDVDEHPEIFDRASARNILATTVEQIDRASAGLLIAGTGGSIPLPSGLGDMINTALQNNALDKKTAAALKQYIADYKAMKDKVIVQQMEMQGGKIGRGNAMAFKAIADQIPNGATPDSATARRQVMSLQQTQDELSKKYGEYGDFKKEKPYQLRAGGKSALPEGAIPGTLGGKHGYALNGKFYEDE